MELFPFTLPKSGICGETELYYHSSKNVLYEEDAEKIVFGRNTVLTLDTYFNCFSYQKYLEYTNVKILEIHVKLQGNVRVRLMKAELIEKQVRRTELLAQDIQNEDLQTTVLSYDFSHEKSKGIFYLELTALSEQAVFAGGYYAIPAESRNTNNVKIAAVICTYHREEYIKHNLNYLAATIFDKPDRDIAGYLQILVVDNGQTLEAGAAENKHVKLFPNKNYGGSGGFTRGMIEALRMKEEFSHILLMDDDILLEGNVLIKTIRFLQLLRQEYQNLVIGASMLCLDRMAVQNEAGATWTGIRIKQGNHNLDLRYVEALLENENMNKPQYTAWWYCCIPLGIISENELPVPFFIKMDDIEYSLRRFQEILILNGIGVWHEIFAKKQTEWLDYYNLRNKLVINTIYEAQFPLIKNLFLLGCYIGKNLLKGSSTMIEFPIRGCYDYLKGIQYFKTVEGDQQHKILLEEYQKLLQSGKNTLFNWLMAAKEYFILAAKLIYKYNHLKLEYRTGLKEITSAEYWNKKLEI